MTTSRLKSGASLPEFTRSASPSIGTLAPRLSWARWPAFIIVALIGLAVRLPQLGARPMHTDEAINGYIVGQLLEGETFAYDPQDRHGPALAALALPLARMQGAKSFSDLTESELRSTSVVAGTITILAFWRRSRHVRSRSLSARRSAVRGCSVACLLRPVFHP